jgi:GDPmannose 4,6-dehydratase
MKRAIIVGASGQDGRLLFDRLAARDYALLGIGRDTVRTLAAPSPPPVNVLDPAAVESIVADFQPDQIFYLAAFHNSAEKTLRLSPRELFEKSYQLHVSGLINFLHATVRHAPKSRLFYAASSHIFGDPLTTPQTEQTPLNPICPYGITKAAGIHACRFYRHSHAIHASAGILFNHESPLRRPDFVSQKIVRAAVNISMGLQDKLILGDLAARVDWGWAADYVPAMAQILDLPAPDDFIIATGQAHSVQEFAAEAFTQLGLDWKKHVDEDPSLVPRRRTDLVGNFAKLHHATGWQPSTSFPQMIRIMIQAAREQSIQKTR